MEWIQGNDLMLFMKNTDGTVKSLAFATSHSLSITGETNTISTKDFGFWGATQFQSINWSINSDNLMSVKTFNELFDRFISRQTVEVYFCLKSPTERAGNPQTVNLPGDEYDTWTPTTTEGEEGYYGKAFITSLDITSQSGDVSTFSATFSGVGALTKGLYGEVEAVAGGSTDIVVDEVTYERASGAYDSTKEYYIYSNGVMVKADISSAAEYNKLVLYIEKS